jgi:RNA polymerase sigma-70 factor (ECF subfamily)
MLASAGLLIETAYADHRSSVIRRLTAITRDPDIAEDLAQDAFARLSLEVAAGRTPDNLAGWLHRVARNLAMSRGRHLSVVDRHAPALRQSAVPATPEGIVVAAEMTSAVTAVLASLPEAERTALLLAAHGYRGSEIAAEIGRTDAATRTLMCRARTKVRKQLIEAGFGRSELHRT